MLLTDCNNVFEDDRDNSYNITDNGRKLKFSVRYERWTKHCKLPLTPEVAVYGRFDSGQKVATDVNIPKVFFQGQPLYPANQSGKQ